MIRAFKVMKFYLGYFFYFLLTVNERRNYLQALEKGYDCISSKDDSYLIYGSATIFSFDKNKPPQRYYITYVKYKKEYYPKKL